MTPCTYEVEILIDGQWRPVDGRVNGFDVDGGLLRVDGELVSGSWRVFMDGKELVPDVPAAARDLWKPVGDTQEKKL